MRPFEAVVGHAEPTGGEQVFAIAVPLKRPRLAHQPVDDVPIIDTRCLLRPRSRGKRSTSRLGVPDLQVLDVEPDLDLLADQSAGDRIGIAVHVDQAARIHPGIETLATLVTVVRQRT